jgi:amino acid transporter
VILAYLISGLLIIPAMVSQAELATAMPRAGGAYYFLDRTLGPLMGSVGGIGTWFALMLKSAFALIGMGAYISIFLEVPFKPVAIAFAVVFAILNIFGSKESSSLVRVLVFALLTILAFFLIDGLTTVVSSGIAETHEERFVPFMPEGIDGLLGTVGLVFISYVGLTQIASLAEEVKEPDRNIPLGMALSLATVICIYVLGVYVMVAVLGIDELSQSLTPVALCVDVEYRDHGRVAVPLGNGTRPPDTYTPRGSRTVSNSDTLNSADHSSPDRLPASARRRGRRQVGERTSTRPLWSHQYCRGCHARKPY